MTRRTFAVSLAFPALFRGQNTPSRKRRAESFFGLHFDLHPSPGDPALGRDVTEAMVDRLLATVKPDFVQYDSKGHVGWLGWPESKVGPSAPHIVKDSLAIWRKVTAQRGVALYTHFSGVWDDQAVRLHPEWAVTDAKGTPSQQKTSTFSSYVDGLMLPELEESAARYDLDGVWIDGECWAVEIDYSPRALEAWKQATGRSEAPRDDTDPHWHEWLEFQRAQFRRYVHHYLAALHQKHANLQVASNWLYSTLVPEKPELPVDFLSGDYLGNAPIGQARLEARYLQQNGKPWDLMAWGFQTATGVTGHVLKSAVQLQQEAAVVVAQGGGFQIYYTPTREGHLEDSTVAVMGKVAAFCRERQAFSHRSEAVPQIGVIFSKESLYSGRRLFGSWGNASAPAAGWLDALLDSQYSADVLPDWKLDSIASRYPVIVLPDWVHVGAETLATARRYAEQGGTLIVSGAANAAAWLGITESPSDQRAFIGGSTVLASVGGQWLNLKPDASMQVLEQRFSSEDTTLTGTPAAVLMKAGRGTVIVVPGPIGALYAASHAPAVREMIRRLLHGRFTPFVSVGTLAPVEVALRTKNGKTYVHLLNQTAMQQSSDYKVVDYIPEVGPILLNFAKPPKSVQLLPSGKEMKAPYRIERLHLHAAIEVL